MKQTKYFAITVLVACILFLGAGCSSTKNNVQSDGDLSDGDNEAAEEEQDKNTTDGDMEGDTDNSDAEETFTDGDEDMESANENSEEQEEEQEAIIEGFPACNQDAETQTISFVHVNDIHATYQIYDGETAAVSSIKGFYNATKAENPYTLFTDGGDDHEKGSVAENISKGQSTRDIIFAMKFDVRVLGNHDFAWGPEHTLDFSDDPHAITLASNTSYDGDNPSDFKSVDFAKMEVGCVTLGFFGMTPKPYDETNTSYEGDFYPGGDFHTRHDYQKVAEEIIAAHGDEVDIMVMVSHLGLGTDESLAENVDGIDVILGGHSHSTINPEKMINNTIIIQAGSDAAFVTRLDLNIDLSDKSISSHEYELKINLPMVMPVDEEFQAEIEGIMNKYAPDADSAVTTLSTSTSETNIANLTALAAINVIEGADAALVDLDTIWKKWSKGNLSKQSFIDTYKVEIQPAGTCGFNSFYKATINGQDLQQLKDALADNTDWALVTPETIDTSSTYTLVLQKRPALRSEYRPSTFELTDTEFLMEAWELLDAYGQMRQAECKYFDIEETIEGCEI